MSTGVCCDTGHSGSEEEKEEAPGRQERETEERDPRTCKSTERDDGLTRSESESAVQIGEHGELTNLDQASLR